jgi:hypothetical protein
MMAALREGYTMVVETFPRALPGDAPNYHERQAAHLRALAASTTIAKIKSRLLREAEKHEHAAHVETEPATAEGEA